LLKSWCFALSPPPPPAMAESAPAVSAAAAALAADPDIKEVVVHPLVLLSVVDHYNRVAKDSKRRVVGVLLGESFKGRVDVTNSFAGVWGLAFVSHLVLCLSPPRFLCECVQEGDSHSPVPSV
jgi:hypothetical protein